MKYFAVILLVSSALFAKDHNWEEAKVLKLVSSDAGTAAMLMPLGNGIVAGAAPRTASFYWIQTDNLTYVIHNYSNGAMVERWLVLTIGGPTKVYVEGRDLHVIDSEGKERKCRILGQIANSALRQPAH